MMKFTETKGKFTETKDKLSLHGLGFLQLKLQGSLRMHIWHPDLPRRSCFIHSGIHSHRFSFRSKVIRGMIKDTRYKRRDNWGEHTHLLYKHEGERTRKGNRPWIPTRSTRLEEVEDRHIEVGEEYKMKAHAFHKSVCVSKDGIAVTLFDKTFEDDKGSHSACKLGVVPEVDFDRKQVSQDDMWKIVREVLS